MQEFVTHKENRFIYTLEMWSLNLLTLLAIGILCLTLFWLLYPYKTIEVEEPMKILTPVIKAGDPIEYEVSYCKFKGRPGAITANC